MSAPALELNNVSKTYQSNGLHVEALNSVSLSLAPGTITALLGRSGCGKTTLLNLAGAMDFPTSGEVRIDGVTTAAMSETDLTALRRNRIGFVFQFFQLLPTMTVLENVELPLLLAGRSRSREPALERLRWVGLEDKAGVLPHQLSGGQMQRVAIARALVHSPRLLIADEPTGNLDSALGAGVLELIERGARELGVTVLMATHSLEAASIAGRQVHLRDGRMVDPNRPDLEPRLPRASL